MASNPPPPGCTTRPIDLDDVEALVELFRRRDESLGLRPEPAGSFLRWLLQLPFVRLDRDTVALVRGHDLVAAMTTMRDPAVVGSSLRSEAAVDPSVRGLGVGPWLVDRLEAIARQRAAEGPFPIDALVPSVDAEGGALFESRGFALERVSNELALDLPAPGPAIEPPAGIVIRTFRDGSDERTLWRVHEEAFRGHFGFDPSPYESFAAEWYETDEWDPEKVYLAQIEGEVVGEAAWVDADAEGYIVSVGVLPAFRRRGIGAALLARTIRAIERAGKERVTLSVDSENATGALGLYGRAGMREYRRWHLYRKGAP